MALVPGVDPSSTMVDRHDLLELATSVGERLRATDATVATAESITGGLLASTLTDVPGSSDYVDRGFVTYAYDAKRQVLCVERELLDDHGAVSEPVAVSMARGARDVADVTWGLGVTGIAGPTGAMPEKPIGTVFVGIAHAAPWGSGRSFARAQRHLLDGDRLAVKRAAVERALRTLESAIDLVDGDAKADADGEGYEGGEEPHGEGPDPDQ